MPAPIPENDRARVDALFSFRVLDTPPEEAYDDLTRLVSAICGTPIALVSLLDDVRQWFKSRVGVDATETPRDFAFCGYAILGRDVFVVPDAAADVRFCNNPLVTGDPRIRFYAGMPLTTPEGFNVGTLCAIDRVPRSLTTEQTESLRVLARQVVAHLLLRRQVAAQQEALAERDRLAADLRASEERFRAFMEHAPALAYMKDQDGRFVFVNGTVCRRFARPEANWLGRTDVELFGEEVAGPLREVDQRVLATGDTERALELAPTPDGVSEVWLSDKFRFTDGAGRRFLAGMSVDVTAEQRAEESLRASETKFRAVVNRLAEGVFLIDAARGVIVEANAALLALLGYTHEELLALSPTDLIAGEHPDATAAHVAAARARLAADERCDLGRTQYRRKDGAPVDVEVKVTLVPNDGAGLYCVIVRDVTEERVYEERLFAYQHGLEQANAKLKALATTDGLTGLRNRAALNARLAEECERAVRHGHPLSLVLMDVDHFKQFNDKFGHPAGDDVLRAVGAVLQATARATDFVARYGGEEFVLVLPDTDHVGALVMAERCRRAIMTRSWDRRPVTISVGATTLHPAADSPAALVQEADDALYESKRAGRNRVTHRAGNCPPIPA